MRMWMLPPQRLCRKHLLGEHVETHMFLGSLLKKKNLGGFFGKHLLEPGALLLRHDELAAEMVRRGYVHKSPMEPAKVRLALSGLPPVRRAGTVDREKARTDLAARCAECKTLLEAALPPDDPVNPTDSESCRRTAPKRPPASG